MKYFVSLGVLVMLLPSTYAQNKMPPPAKHAATAASKSAGPKVDIQKMAHEWAAAFKAKDADKVAAMYTDDAVWINAEGTFHGTGDITSELKKMMDRGDTVVAITSNKTLHSGDIGYAEGTYSGNAPNPKTGAEAPAHGSWVVTIKNSNGKWMIATHTSVPGAAAAATSKSAKESE
jgi:uncharacterized protein (TIGR02246 family)